MLGDACLQIIELRIQDAHLPQVSAFERLQLRANLRELRLALCKHRAHDRQLLPLFNESSIRRRL